MNVPITEQRNKHSEHIDVLNARDIVSCLEKCDAEIFGGWQTEKGLSDQTFVDTLSSVSDVLATHCKDADKSLVVISGCGTSGRLAFCVYSAFKRRVPCLEYLIAGGDRALFSSQEAYEDDPQRGRDDLIKVCEGRSRVLYIGISCSLAAPYVAGQLDYCTQHPRRFTPVLIGFNPVHLARTLIPEKWDKSFKEVATRLDERVGSSEGFILNPILGPEAITGSTRMKSGSATKIMLEVLISSATSQHTPCDGMIRAYNAVREAVYSQADDIAQLVQLAANSLRAGGHIYYVSHQRLGVVGLLDASECPPTYGASYDDVRGFIGGGFEVYGNREGAIQGIEISMEYFLTRVTLTDQDLVICLSSECPVAVDAHVTASGCTTALVNISKSLPQTVTEGEKQQFDAMVEVMLPIASLNELLSDDTVRENTVYYTEIVCKWICNAVSTSAHVMCGKVYHNMMVDVTVSNSKLFHRAMAIIESVAQCSPEVAQESLLKSIYETDNLSEEHFAAPVSRHVTAASSRIRVVPIALVISLLQCTVSKAQDLLAENPVVRSVLLQSACSV